MLRGSRQRPKYKQAVDYYTWKFQQALATKPAFRVRFRVRRAMGYCPCLQPVVRPCCCTQTLEHEVGLEGPALLPWLCLQAWSLWNDMVLTYAALVRAYYTLSLLCRAVLMLTA